MKPILLTLILSFLQHGSIPKDNRIYSVCRGGNLLYSKAEAVLKRNHIQSGAGESTGFEMWVSGKANALKAIKVLKAAHIKGLTVFDKPRSSVSL